MEKKEKKEKKTFFLQMVFKGLSSDLIDIAIYLKMKKVVFLSVRNLNHIFKHTT